ncbi:DUF488 domain-containing protein [Arthrobacter sp. Sa2BUA2]|uniref:DUF488 domain-containing protein n=1 Tax=Arthrobacter pullicola TaxID=2762224 RepID=A0ABR8YES3_9MICC|nr:DUF488 domain-containing protein [Arthrobacter pullicola]MBD8042710.1 DUF488 domain-containing protein [Arthrobacter pullicola]
MGKPPIFTIGHSNRPLDEFLELLQESAIEQVADVRKLPGSKKYPQFNNDALEVSLAEHGIKLIRLEALTGRRPVNKDVPFEVNAWWENRSFHNYADHALSAEFREALAALLGTSASSRTALMCSEAVWWRCHRRIIADHLLVRDAEVCHILGKGQVKPAELSAGAVVDADRGLTYPAL